jgi:LuxR family maltose regulon positive regulatory protein
MSIPVLATKLYIPPPRSRLVLRPRLVERLSEGVHGKLTLISAPAGFGKTTLVCEWIGGCGKQVAWLSLDEGDNDPTRFLTYLAAAMQMIIPSVGERALGVLQSPQPPSAEAVLTVLLNEIATLSDDFVLILDDYHVIDAQPVDHALAFLIEHLPPQLHLVIVTREDPQIPLARLRARGHLAELRVTDLRFTPSEAAEFLSQVMDLNLSAEDIAALETRTEGWIAGLQLAAISMQGHPDASRFIKSFTGSHYFVMDYLVEEVLHRQPESVQTFLLHTSILDRLCGSLCDAVLCAPAGTGQETLEYLDHSNLFIIPLDNERRWYRYHHLFSDLLRQRMRTASTGDGGRGADEYHKRASGWYETNRLELEAFHHAAAAHDVERAARLMEGGGMPLHFRGAVAPVLHWLESLSPSVLDARPSLWVMYASALSMTGQTDEVEEKLQAAEAALQAFELDDHTRNLIGHIAAIRALLAATHYQIETIITQSRRALEYLHPNNLPVRTATIWKMGIAYEFQGNRAAALQAYTEAAAISQASGNMIIHLSAATGLGKIQESNNQLPLAAETYRHILKLAGDPPQLFASEACLGLARIFYEWNDLAAARQYGQQASLLAHPLANTDRFVPYKIFFARLKLAQDDFAGAAAILSEVEQLVRQHNFVNRISEVAAIQVLILLRQGYLPAAAHLAQMHDLPLSQVRVLLAQGDPSAALAILEPLRGQMEAKAWADQLLKVLVLEVLAYDQRGDKNATLQLLQNVLTLAEPGGFIRTFADEGRPMAQLLSDAAVYRMSPDYISRLLAAFEPAGSPDQALIEPLSHRELEVLRLIAQGLSNHEISERLFLALSTVKGHNQKIFDKLQVQRRTEAIARARELGLL